jgi:predicted nucleic acid-binding protein
LFEKVFVPDAVYEELTDVGTPGSVRRRLGSLPGWFEVCAVDESHQISFPVKLHRGERQAILLAETLKVDVLLIDDQVGRAIALTRKIPLSGTLGVLERADKEGLVRDFPQVLQQLKMSGFFFTQALGEQLLSRHKARRGG